MGSYADQRKPPRSGSDRFCTSAWVEDCHRPGAGVLRRDRTELPLIHMREFSRIHRKCSIQFSTEKTVTVSFSSSEVYGGGVCSRKVLKRQAQNRIAPIEMPAKHQNSVIEVPSIYKIIPTTVDREVAPTKGQE